MCQKLQPCQKHAPRPPPFETTAVYSSTTTVVLSRRCSPRHARLQAARLSSASYVLEAAARVEAGLWLQAARLASTSSSTSGSTSGLELRRGDVRRLGFADATHVFITA